MLACLKEQSSQSRGGPRFPVLRQSVLSHLHWVYISRAGGISRRPGEFRHVLQREGVQSDKTDTLALAIAIARPSSHNFYCFYGPMPRRYYGADSPS